MVGSAMVTAAWALLRSGLNPDTADGSSLDGAWYWSGSGFEPKHTGGAREADLMIDAPAGKLVAVSARVMPAVADLFAMMLPLLPAATPHGLVLAHMGQSLDGHIATAGGHSHVIGGPESLDHLHRLRALVEAVLVGAETACLDRPRLTVRRVVGANPVRVVVDPRGRLPADSPVLTDTAAPTLVLRAGSTAGHLSACAETLAVPAGPDGFAPADILQVLAARGLTRLLIEGGGGTVSRFLAAGRLDRLQLSVAPLLIGSGRPALALPPIDRLDQALRPPTRRWSLGADTLFDMDLRGVAARRSAMDSPATMI